MAFLRYHDLEVGKPKRSIKRCNSPLVCYDEHQPEIDSNVKEKPVSTADLSATILHHLGIDPQQIWGDEFQNLPRKLSEGKVVRDLG